LAKLPGGAATLVAELLVTAEAGDWPGLAAGAPVQAASNAAATISSQHS
jgi:hypothetical protein